NAQWPIVRVRARARGSGRVSLSPARTASMTWLLRATARWARSSTVRMRAPTLGEQTPLMSRNPADGAPIAVLTARDVDDGLVRRSPSRARGLTVGCAVALLSVAGCTTV